MRYSSQLISFVIMVSTTPVRPAPSWKRIEAAMGVIDPVFLNTPLATNPALNETLGCHLVAKVETLNPIRSFKGRGTSFFVQSALSGDIEKIVTASAGNFGQGLAHAAAAIGTDLVVYASTAANPDKIDAMRRLGATVILEGGDFDAAKSAATVFAAEQGLYLVIDGNEPAIAEGAGTIALEMLRQWTGGELNSLVVPLGNGALATGVGTWVKYASPETEVVAVAPRGAPSMAISWRDGKSLETATVDTIADGLAVRVPVQYALDAMEDTVDSVVEVDDETLITAMRLVHRYFGLVVEPSGVAGIAAVLADPARWEGRSVGTVLCGANIDRSRASQWLFDKESLHDVADGAAGRAERGVAAR